MRTSSDPRATTPGGTADGARATSPVERRPTTGELASLAQPCHPWNRVAGLLLAAVFAIPVNAVPGNGVAEPGPWMVRVEALDPDDPMAYFELAEEIADASAEDSRRELARHLFALSGVLSPQRLGRSACLALADLEEDEHTKRRLLALAALLDERAGGLIVGPAGETAYHDRASVVAVTNALSFYRTGNGAKAVTALRTATAKEILDTYDSIFRGGSERFIEDCRLYRGTRRPMVAEPDRLRVLRFEAALLAGDDRSWSGELLLNRGRPLIEVDPDRLGSSFGVNASQPCYRNGRWQACE